MLRRLRHWVETRRLRDSPLRSQWEQAVADWPVMARYQGEARERLREMALRLILRKYFLSGGGLLLTDAMRLRVATMAAVPVLELGLDWLRDWNAIVLYEGAFIPDHGWQDEAGVVHTGGEPLSGEAWALGPVILSWEDVLAASAEDGYNVVIHEIAHKLDMRSDGGANGAPPLHRGMNARVWYEVMTDAWNALARAEEAGEPLPVDGYALTEEAEFFAVLSENFFEAPERLQQALPRVYEQLALFYRQDPAALSKGVTQQVP